MKRKFACTATKCQHEELAAFPSMTWLQSVACRDQLLSRAILLGHSHRIQSDSKTFFPKEARSLPIGRSLLFKDEAHVFCVGKTPWMRFERFSASIGQYVSLRVMRMRVALMKLSSVWQHLGYFKKTQWIYKNLATEFPAAFEKEHFHQCLRFKLPLKKVIPRLPDQVWLLESSSCKSSCRV